MIVQKRNNLFAVEFSKDEQTNLIMGREAMAELWHSRYGHLNVQDFQCLFQSNMVLGLPEIKSLIHCEDCVYNELSRSPFQAGRSWKANKRFQLIHADVCGPM